MKGFTRPCHHLTCDADAVIWFHGPWCAKHAWDNFGVLPTTLAKLEEASRLRREGRAPSEPPVRGQAPSGTWNPFPTDGAAPISEAELFDILERDYWQDADR